MRIPWDDRFATERADFALRHCCEDCGLFDAEAGRYSHKLRMVRRVL